MKWFPCLLLAAWFLVLPAAPTRAETSSEQLKSMMLGLQVMTETYAVDFDTYPTNLTQLYRAAQQNDFWLDKVKYTLNEVEHTVPNYPVLYLDAGQSPGPVTGIATQAAKAPLGVIYYRADAGKDYCIFALDLQGGLIKGRQDLPYYLSSKDDDSLCRLP